jgi:putative phosphoribosyl transferase
MDLAFVDRAAAGRRLAAALAQYRGTDSLILALPRGGVVVGHAVARALGLPLDVLITRKIGAPFNPEYAIGAVSEEGDVQLNHREVADLGITSAYINQEVTRQRAEIQRQALLYRGRRPPVLVRGKTVILVDDGIATGFTMFASVKTLRSRDPAAIVVAVPVSPPSTADALAREADRVVCLLTPDPFYAVGNWYQDFDQVTDEEVRSLLQTAAPTDRTPIT